MRFLVVCAGIPSEWYDSIKVKGDAIVGSDGVFVGAPLSASSDGKYRYKDSYINKLLRHTGECFLGADEPHLRDTGIVLSFINHSSGTEKKLIENFFPFALCEPVQAEICSAKPRKYRDQKKNEFANQLRRSVHRLKKAARPVKPEIQSNANRTPLLLPYRNFGSQKLDDCLRRLFDELVGTDDPVTMIKQLIRLFKKTHDLQRIGEATRTCYVNGKNVAFVLPGTATHGFARPHYGDKHPITCLLNGRTRLGAPYNWSFHYDCVKATGRGRPGKLIGKFLNCHGVKDSYRGNPHLNIAPNDFVRT